MLGTSERQYKDKHTTTHYKSQSRKKQEQQELEAKMRVLSGQSINTSPNFSYDFEWTGTEYVAVPKGVDDV